MFFAFFSIVFFSSGEDRGGEREGGGGGRWTLDAGRWTPDTVVWKQEERAGREQGLCRAGRGAVPREGGRGDA